MKIKIHSTCEIEDFVETHICKLCVILRSRVVLPVVGPHQVYIPVYARSEYHTQLAKMSFEEIVDLTAGGYFHFL